MCVFVMMQYIQRKKICVNTLCGVLLVFYVLLSVLGNNLGGVNNLTRTVVYSQHGDKSEVFIVDNPIATFVLHSIDLIFRYLLEKD